MYHGFSIYTSLPLVPRTLHYFSHSIHNLIHLPFCMIDTIFSLSFSDNVSLSNKLPCDVVSLLLVFCYGRMLAFVITLADMHPLHECSCIARENVSLSVHLGNDDFTHLQIMRHNMVSTRLTIETAQPMQVTTDKAKACEPPDSCRNTHACWRENKGQCHRQNIS